MTTLVYLETHDGELTKGGLGVLGDRAFFEERPSTAPEEGLLPDGRAPPLFAAGGRLSDRASIAPGGQLRKRARTLGFLARTPSSGIQSTHPSASAILSVRAQP